MLLINDPRYCAWLFFVYLFLDTRISVLFGSPENHSLWIVIGWNETSTLGKLGGGKVQSQLCWDFLWWDWTLTVSVPLRWTSGGQKSFTRPLDRLSSTSGGACSQAVTKPKGRWRNSQQCPRGPAEEGACCGPPLWGPVAPCRHPWPDSPHTRA